MDGRRRRLSEGEVRSILSLAGESLAVRSISSQLRICRPIVNQVLAGTYGLPSRGRTLNEHERKYGVDACKHCGDPLPCRRCAEQERLRVQSQERTFTFMPDFVPLNLHQEERERYERLNAWKREHGDCDMEKFFELELIREGKR